MDVGEDEDSRQDRKEAAEEGEERDEPLILSEPKSTMMSLSLICEFGCGRSSWAD